MNQGMLRERYSELESDVLRQMWAAEERMPWAEEILRAELIGRGVPADELDAVAVRRSEIARDAPPSMRDTLFGFGVMGRAGAAFLAVVAGNLLGSLLGKRAAIVGVLVVAVAYAVILVIRVRRQSRHPSGALAGAAMVWQCTEACLIAAACAIATWVIFSGNV